MLPVAKGLAAAGDAAEEDVDAANPLVGLQQRHPSPL
jgi:hypothetical protein